MKLINQSRHEHSLLIEINEDEAWEILNIFDRSKNIDRSEKVSKFIEALRHRASTFRRYSLTQHDEITI